MAQNYETVGGPQNSSRPHATWQRAWNSDMNHKLFKLYIRELDIIQANYQIILINCLFHSNYL